MAECDREQALSEALLESLTAVLSPSKDVRAAGEKQVQALEVTEEFGVILAQFVVNTENQLSIRQLASVLLKQYVECHWCIHSEKFRPPEATDAAKSAIRRILPAGLSESVSKVRVSTAYAVSAIAHWDWPDSWPELFDVLMVALTSGNHHGVHGAMRVLAEFTRELTDTQMPLVAPIILPEMFRIFTQDQVFTIRTRSRAVVIFTTCTTTIFQMAAVDKTAARDLLFPILPRFAEALVHVLQAPDGPTSDCGLRAEILKALTCLVKGAPKKMAQWFHAILPPIWSTLTGSAEVYVRTVVNASEAADDPVDSDGEALGFDNLVYGVFEFIHTMIESSKLQKTLSKSMEQLLYYAMLYSQITEEQCQAWTQNPDQFVEDEDEESFSYSVRISAQDLLSALLTEFEEEPSIACLERAVSQHLQEAARCRAAGSTHWWKLHEAVMLSLGSVRSVLMDAVKERRASFDLTGFLHSVVLADLNDPLASPFLIGRCLWTASRFAQAADMNLADRFLAATVAGLHQSQPASVRVSAARAVCGFSEALGHAQSRNLLLPRLADLFEGLLSLAQSYSSEVLALCLETLYELATVDDGCTSSYQGKIIPLMVTIFLKCSNDQHVVALVQDVIGHLAGLDACRDNVQRQLLGTLVGILQAPQEDGKLPSGLQSASLDLLESLVRNSNAPISDGLLHAFPLVANVTLLTDDNSTMQSGSECLRAYVSKAAEQVAAWHDEQGRSGLFYIGQTVSKLLDPKCSEFAATFVGKLVSLLISKLGSSLGSDLDLMLRAVLSKMQQAETLTVLQELIMVFVRLVHTQMDALLEFLTSVPGPDGQPALNFVLREWCSKQHLFYGARDTKMGATALGKLLQYALSSNDTRLQGIMVTGDQIFDRSATGMRTRSSKGEEQWTVVPVLVKMYKLLVNELSTQLESAMSGGEGHGAVDEDEDWQDVDENTDNRGDENDFDDGGGRGDGGGEGVTLSSLLEEVSPIAANGELDDETDDDRDMVDYPTCNVNLRQYLIEFFLSLSASPFYPMFSAHHNKQEVQVLRTAGIPVQC